MTLRYIDTESRAYGGTGHVTGVIPAATESGDVLIAVAAARSYDAVIASSGFTEIAAAQGAGNTDIDRPLVAYRILGAAETPPTSVDFSTVSTVEDRAVSILTYRPSTSIASLDISPTSWVTSGGGAVPADPFIRGGSLTYEDETFSFGDMDTSPSENAYGRVAFVIKEPGAHVQRGLLLHCAATNSGSGLELVSYSPSPFIAANPEILADRLSLERADTVGDGATAAQRMTVAVMEMKLGAAGWRLWVSE